MVLVPANIGLGSRHGACGPIRDQNQAPGANRRPGLQVSQMILRQENKKLGGAMTHVSANSSPAPALGSTEPGRTWNVCLDPKVVVLNPSAYLLAKIMKFILTFNRMNLTLY